MDECSAASIAKHASDFHGIAARDLSGFLRVVAGEAARNLAAGLAAIPACLGRGAMDRSAIVPLPLPGTPGEAFFLRFDQVLHKE